MTHGPNATEFNITEKRNFGNIFTMLECYMFNVWFFFSDKTFRYYVFYFWVSIVGYLNAPVFYAFHLFDVVYRFDTLRSAIKSVTENIA